MPVPDDFPADPAADLPDGVTKPESHDRVADNTPDTGWTAVLISCGGQKQETVSKAKDLYTGSYFSKMQEYAETFADGANCWAIMSAKYGFVWPTELLPHYDRYAGNFGEMEELAWVRAVHEDVLAWVTGESEHGPSTPAGRLIILGGSNYTDPLAEVIPAESDEQWPEVVMPFREYDVPGTGYQMGWMNDRVENGVAVQPPDADEEETATDGGQATLDGFTG